MAVLPPVGFGPALAFVDELEPDPYGRARPGPVDSTGWTTVPTAVLLGAVGVIATGLVVLVTRRPR